MSIELAWTIISTIGLGVAIWGFFDASADLHALTKPSNGRLIIARGYRRAEGIRIVVQFILLMLGLAPLFNPEPVRLSAFVGALIVVNLLLLTNSVLDAVDRLNVRRSVK